MTPTSSDRITLTDTARTQLLGVVRAATTPQRLALRARIVLAAATGQPTAGIAADLGICADTARK